MLGVDAGAYPDRVGTDNDEGATRARLGAYGDVVDMAVKVPTLSGVLVALPAGTLFWLCIPSDDGRSDRAKYAGQAIWTWTTPSFSLGTSASVDGEFPGRVL